MIANYIINHLNKNKQKNQKILYTKMILEYNVQKNRFFSKNFTENVVVNNFKKDYIVRKLGGKLSGGRPRAFCLNAKMYKRK